MDEETKGTDQDDGRVSGTTLLDGEYVVASLPAADPALCDELTDAETQITRAILEGLSDAEIASRRGTSKSTVRNQIASIFEKMDVESRFELVARIADLSDA